MFGSERRFDAGTAFVVALGLATFVGAADFRADSLGSFSSAVGSVLTCWILRLVTLPCVAASSAVQCGVSMRFGGPARGRERTL